MPSELVATEVVTNTTRKVQELVAVQVTPTPDYHLSPLFDQAPAWGVPIWVWMLLALFIYLVFRNGQWWRRKMVMKPVLGYLEAFKSGLRSDIQVWIFGKNRSFNIETLTYHDDGVVAYPLMAKLSTWFLGSSMAVGHAGGIKQISVSDNFDRVRDFPAEMALMSVVDQFNAENVPTTNGDLQTDSKGKPLVIQNYDDYEYFRPLLEQKHPGGIVMKCYDAFDPTKAEKIFPPNRSAGFQGGYMLRKARKLMVDMQEKSFWDKYTMLFVAIGFDLLMVIGTYAYLSMGKGG